MTSVDNLKEQIARQEHLLHASYALHSTLDLDELLGVILDAARRGVHAERGTVFLLSDDGTEIWSRVLQGDKDLVIRLPVGKGIAGIVAASGQTINIIDAHEDERFDASWDKKTGFRTRQILCAPIRGRDDAIVGLFQLLNKDEGNFTTQDEEFLASLSVPAALALENARLHRSALEKERQDREIALAQSVQRAFQPETAETAKGILVAAGMNELCEDASGDYYDFLELPSGKLGVVVGDVAGHGLGASLVMAQARAFLRAFASTQDSLQDVVQLLNNFLCADMSSGNFMCMFLAVVDPETGSMEWCNAGHPPGYLLRAATGEVEELGACGPVLGVVPGVPYSVGESTGLARGDMLLLYTDGVTEANGPGGEMFGYPRLRDVLVAEAAGGPLAVLAGVRKNVVAWSGSEHFEDDLTLLAMQVTPPAE
ncbi:MAG: SpoIIE family protein phosphatase [Planctomycetota bacterium]|nr:SpoIIE family protein phosphatase [Planctomycetota bacterium]